MINFKSALIGLGTVLSGCAVVPIAMLIWASWRTETRPNGIGFSFSPIGLVHSVGF
jgi:hypothetical protein